MGQHGPHIRGGAHGDHHLGQRTPGGAVIGMRFHRVDQDCAGRDQIALCLRNTGPHHHGIGIGDRSGRFTFRKDLARQRVLPLRKRRINPRGDWRVTVLRRGQGVFRPWSQGR